MSETKNEVASVIGNLPAEWKDIDILVNNAGLAVGLLILIMEISMTGTG